METKKKTSYRIMSERPGFRYEPKYTQSIDSAHRFAAGRFNRDFMEPHRVLIQERIGAGRYASWKTVETWVRSGDSVQQYIEGRRRGHDHQ